LALALALALDLYLIPEHVLVDLNLGVTTCLNLLSLALDPDLDLYSALVVGTCFLAQLLCIYSRPQQEALAH
jgi:hypothetical protein